MRKMAHPHRPSSPVFTIRTRTKAHRPRPTHTPDRSRSRHETRHDIHRPEPNPIYAQVYPFDLVPSSYPPWRRRRRTGITRTRERFILKTRSAPRDILCRNSQPAPNCRLNARCEQMQSATRSRCALACDVFGLRTRNVLRPARPLPSTDANKKTGRAEGPDHGRRISRRGVREWFLSLDVRFNPT